jgi:hypothetical protein
MTPDVTVTHGWACSRPPLEDRYVHDPKTGEPRVERRCPSCGAVEQPAQSRTQDESGDAT